MTRKETQDVLRVIQHIKNPDALVKRALAGAETPQGMDEAPSCPDHGVMVATNEHGFACAVCQRIACDVCRTGAWCDLAERCLAECLPTDEDAPLRAVFDGPEPAAAPPPAVDPPALVAKVQELRESYSESGPRFGRALDALLAWTPADAAPPVTTPDCDCDAALHLEPKHRPTCATVAAPAVERKWTGPGELERTGYIAPPLASGSARAARPAVEDDDSYAICENCGVAIMGQVAWTSDDVPLCHTCSTALFGGRREG